MPSALAILMQEWEADRPARDRPASYRRQHPTGPTTGIGASFGPQRLLALQRLAGNRAVVSRIPPPELALGQMMHKSPVEEVKSLLEYGVVDWAVTDDDARRACQILADMSPMDLAKAVATLDSSSTPYLERMVDNAPYALVRTPGFAKVVSQRQAARNVALAKQLVSYKFLDWEVTPPEALAAQTLLDSVPEGDKKDALAEGWLQKRIQENLPQGDDYETGIGEQLLDGALQGDFNEDPTFWNVVSQIGVGLVPYAGQVADIRDLLAAIDEMFDEKKQGYKKVTSWINLVLVLVGFVPGIGDLIKGLGKAAMKAVKGAAIKVGRGLWDKAFRHLVEPLIKHLLPDVVVKAKARLRELLEARAKKLAAEHPNGPQGVSGDASKVDVPGGAVPSIAELSKATDEAFVEAAKGAPRRTGRVISELVHDAMEALKAWAGNVYKELEFIRFDVEVKGDDLILYGISSKYPLIRANIKTIKRDIVQKTDFIMRQLKERDKLLKAARAAADDVAGAIRKEAIDISEGLGEHIANILIKRELPGAKLLFTGSGSGTLDKVFELGGVLHVVEAKGGAGRLGSREIAAAGQRAEQGSAAYLVSVLNNMALSTDKAEAEIANQLLKKLKQPGSVRMWVTSTGKLNINAAEPLTVKLIEVAIP